MHNSRIFIFFFWVQIQYILPKGNVHVIDPQTLNLTNQLPLTIPNFLYTHILFLSARYSLYLIMLKDILFHLIHSIMAKATEKKAADKAPTEKKIPIDASSTDKKKMKRSKKSIETYKIYMFEVLKKILMLKSPPVQLYQHLWTTTRVKPVFDATATYLNEP